jgi:hypothetical protein
MMDRQQFLNDLDTHTLENKYLTSIDKVAALRKNLTELRESFRDADYCLNLRRSALIQTEEYSKGKNAEIRDAWLLEQTVTDSDYRFYTKKREELLGKIANAEDELNHAGNMMSFAKAQCKRATATLLFLGE